MQSTTRLLSVLVAGALSITGCDDATVDQTVSPSITETTTVSLDSGTTPTTNSQESTAEPTSPGTHNVLLIILDDPGVDSAECCDGDVAAMPNLAALCDQGLAIRPRLVESGLFSDPRHNDHRQVRVSHRGRTGHRPQRCGSEV